MYRIYVGYSPTHTHTHLSIRTNHLMCYIQSQGMYWLGAVGCEGLVAVGLEEN